MRAILVRVGVDQEYGGWNAPVDPSTGEFVYVPIPEGAKQFQNGQRRSLGEFLLAVDRFHESRALQPRLHPTEGVRSPGSAVHLDPDFEHLTYGDDGKKRGKEVAQLASGDLLVFYSGLKPIEKCEHKLVYAIVGLYVVNEVAAVGDIPSHRWHENAHTRKAPHFPGDIVVRAKPRQSGKLQRCLPIGEWRERAYRVREDLLKAWGGLSVKNGFIQRSAVPPSFRDPERFYSWFKEQSVSLVARNF